MSSNSMRPFEVTTSAWEFEQQRDVARVLDAARRATAANQGKPIEELGESAWVGRTDNAGVGFHVLSDDDPDVEIDFDELDSWDHFYGPNGGYWK